MDFLFVDRITSFDPPKLVTGVKHVVSTERYLRPSRRAPGNTILIPCLVGETLGQMAVWTAIKQHDFRFRPVVGVIGQVNLRGEAKVGDTMDLSITIDSLDEEKLAYHGDVKVDGEIILELIDVICPLLPMEDFIDPDVARRQFNIIHRPIEKDSEIGPMPKSSAKYGPVTPFVISHDDVAFNDQDQSVQGMKKISWSDPYFDDHFPRKPVFPLSLLLECYMGLADQLLKETGKDAVIQSFSRFKIIDFIMPGDIIINQVQLKPTNEGHGTIRCNTLVNGKRIAGGIINYQLMS